MDKVELTREDITALLDWRDEHKELVRRLPAPLKAVEIVFTHNDFRIKGIREKGWLKLYVSKGYQSLSAEQQREIKSNFLFARSIGG